MKTLLGFLKNPVQRRALGLIVGCVVVLMWNMALAQRRKYYSGKMIVVEQKDVVLKVECPGRIEPKIQETLRSTINGLKKQLHVREGDHVTKGQLLLEIDDSEVRSLLNKRRNEFNNALVEFNKAKKDYTLAKNLYRQLAVPYQDVENAQQALTRTQQNLQGASEELQKTEVDAKGAAVFSPIDGVILKIAVQNEDWVTKDKEIIKVAQMENYLIRGKVDELDIAKVKTEQETTIKCDAYPNTVLEGKVDWIGAQAAEGAFPEVEVTIDILDKKGLELKPNLSCEAEIVTGRMPNAIVIPTEAVRQRKSGPFVLKTSGLGWLREQPVVVEAVNSGQVIVKQGLSPKDVVLVPGQN